MAFFKIRRRAIRRGRDVTFDLLVIRGPSDGGAVHHKQVYLASIRKSRVGIVGYRVKFWDKVNARLDALGLPCPHRAEVQEVIPVPSSVELYDFEQWEEQARALVGDGGTKLDRRSTRPKRRGAGVPVAPKARQAIREIVIERPDGPAEVLPVWGSVR